MKSLFFLTLVLISFLTIDSLPSRNALILKRITRDATTSGGVFSGLTAEEQVNSHWETFITPSPMVISLLGQLLVVSTKVDFSLAEFPPRDGFKYMRHPESFRASLVQVGNDGWQAFMTAHANMDKIQLYMAQIPVQLKTALKLISKASPKLIGDLLPISLNEIDRIGTECVTISAETATAFHAMMRLLGELLEVTSSSQGKYKTRLTEVQARLNATADQKKFLDESKEYLQKKQKDLDEQVQKYRSAYDQALKDIPTGWTGILQDAGRAFVNSLNALPSMFGSGGGRSPQGASPDPQKDDRVFSFEKSRIYNLIPKFVDQFRRFKNDVEKLLSGKQNISSDATPSQMFKAYSESVKFWENLFKTDTPPDQLAQELSGYFQQAERIYGDFENIYAKFQPNDRLSIKNESDACMVQIDNLEKNMRPLLDRSQRRNDQDGGFATIQAGPTRQIVADDGGRYQGTGGNERFVADSTLQRLRDAETRDDYYFDQLEKNQKKMGELVGQMAMLNMQDIDYEQILDLIAQGISALSTISENWTNLVLFFEAIAERARILIKAPLDTFLSSAKIQVTQDDRDYFVETLTEQAQTINAGAYFLYTVSSTYVDVSGQFLMQRLAGLAKLLATKDENERTTLLNDLRNEAQTAQNQIKEISQKKRGEYKQLVQARRIELEDMLKKLDASTPVLTIQ